MDQMQSPLVASFQSYKERNPHRSSYLCVKTQGVVGDLLRVFYMHVLLLVSYTEYRFTDWEVISVHTLSIK